MSKSSCVKGRAQSECVPTTPDLSAYAKLSHCKWEPYRNSFGSACAAFSQEEGILSQKYHDRNGRRIAILFKNIGVRGQVDMTPPD